MTIDLPSVSYVRRPFVFPSGCSSPSVPEISVVNVCSLPPLETPGVAPRPIIFNIPQMPPPQRMVACINVKPKMSIKYRAINPRKTQKEITGSFLMQSGVSDCLDGQYDMKMSLTLPCMDLKVSSNLPFVKISKKDYEASGCTYKLGLDFGGFSGNMTVLNKATTRTSGIFVRYMVVHYRKGVAQSVSGFQRFAGQGEVTTGPEKLFAAANAYLRAPSYARPGEFTKLLGFTRCSNSKK